MSAMLLAFTACNQNTPVPGADKDISGVNGKIDPEQSTTVTVYCPYSYDHTNSYAILDSICIYNEKGTKVGIGGYVGDYLVPYNGFILLTYHGDEDDGPKTQYKTDIYEVGTAKQMYIALCAYVYRNSSTSYYWDLFSVVTNGKE